MPSTPEIEERLRQQQEAKKRGEPMTFAKALTSEGRRTVNFSRPPVNAARELVDAEVVFGQQMVALEANIRALLGTMRQLQQARMRAFGPPSDGSDLADLDKVEQDLARQAQKVGIGPDGFITIPKE